MPAPVPDPLIALPVALAALPVLDEDAVTPAGRVGLAEEEAGPVALAEEPLPEEDAVAEAEPEPEEELLLP